MIAQSEQQHIDLLTLQESIMEAIKANGPAYHMDISLPLAAVEEFVTTINDGAAEIGFAPLTVGHLGDGKLHYALSAAKGRDWDEFPLTKAKNTRSRFWSVLTDRSQPNMGSAKANWMSCATSSKPASWPPCAQSNMRRTRMG